MASAGTHRLAGVGLWCGVVLLAGVGVTAAAARAAFPGDLAERLDPLRARLLAYLHIVDPLGRQRPAELKRFDRPFAAHPVLALLHVVPGGLFLALAPLQFSSRLREPHRRLHRWAGRVLVLAAVVSVTSGLFFGLLMPFGGAAEAVAIALFGGLFLLALGRAVAAVRTGRVALHREWMIRAFAVALGISTVRVLGAGLDVLLTPAGVRPDHVFVLSVWAGWVSTLAAAELWIAWTRPREAPWAYRRAS
jgi:uncharacterized membrane protein